MIYFLHIPKTGGASVGTFLAEAAGPGRATSQLLWDHLVTNSYKIPEQTRVIYGHLGGLLPIWLGYWPRILTIVRDPIARALSHINHVQRRDDHPLRDLAKGLSITEYCRHPVLRRTVDNFQARYLASLSFARALVPGREPGPQKQPEGAISVQFENALFSLDAAVGLQEEAERTLDTIDAVGINEVLGSSLQVFSRVFGWKEPSLEPQINTAAAGQPRVSDLSAAERQELDELNRIDTAVYRRGCKRFLELAHATNISLDAKAKARLKAIVKG